ncbi:MAG: hypothetical protein KF830_06440, partial [Planctomycetes bacterium]|nr:hypothetical protein [Planctomycetota bacterium]
MRCQEMKAPAQAPKTAEAGSSQKIGSIHRNGGSSRLDRKALSTTMSTGGPTKSAATAAKPAPAQLVSAMQTDMPMVAPGLIDLANVSHAQLRAACEGSCSS